MMMMLITIVLLALLFIIGLSFTLFNFQTNKFIEMIQSFLAETISQYFRNNNPPAVADKKEKKRSAAATHNKVELKSVFATFDKNNDGFITKKELAKSLENIGIHMTEGEVEEMVGKVDSNSDGLIDFDEFCELFESVEGQEEAAGGGGEEEVGGSEGGEGFSDLKGAFDVFDEDRDGLITVEELGLVLSSLGLKEGRRLETCKEMIKQVDMDGDGKVNFDEFKKMMRSGERLIPVS